jgi:hypothetical protein
MRPACANDSDRRALRIATGSTISVSSTDSVTDRARGIHAKVIIPFCEILSLSSVAEVIHWSLVP